MTTTDNENETSPSTQTPIPLKVSKGKQIALFFFATTRGLGVGCAFANAITLCLLPFFPEIPAFTTLCAMFGGVITFHISSAVNREITEMMRAELLYQRIKKLLDDKLSTMATIEEVLKATAVQIAEQEAKVAPKN